MKYKKDVDLEFLKDVKSEDLAELVKILTEPKTEELTKRDIYKQFNPNHSIYWEEIAAEFQHFGGNTIANIFRREGVFYAEILRDVCTTLGIKYNTYLSTIEIEQIFLAEEKKNSFLDKIHQGVRSLEYKDLVGLISVPLFAVKKLTDPAFRVTIDAVNEIAKLRRKYKDSKNLILSEEISDLNLKYSNELVIRDDLGKELVEVKVVETEIQYMRDFDKSVNMGEIGHLLTDILKGSISIPNQTVELVFSPEIQKGLLDGTHKLVEGRAWVIDSSTSKIKEHAKIIQSGQGKQLLSGGYQLLSIAVAQSHLADIEKSLNSIKSLTKQILDKLEAEDISKIEGSIEYLEQQIVFYLKKNNYDNEFSIFQKNQIESIIRESCSWQIKILKEFDNLNKDIEKYTDEDTFGTENTYKKLIEFIGRFETLKKRYELFLKLSILLLSITKLIDPLEKEFTNIKVDRSKFEDLFKTFNDLITKQKLELKSYFNLEDTIEERKKVLNILLGNHKQDMNILELSYVSSLQKIENSFSGNSKILVSFDENAKISRYIVDYNL